MLQAYIMYMTKVQNEHNKENFDALVNYLEDTKKQIEESNAQLEDTLVKLEEAAMELINMENNNNG